LEVGVTGFWELRDIGCERSGAVTQFGSDCRSLK
jgi:hypothetical protein